jgi:hypothetical protein
MGNLCRYCAGILAFGVFFTIINSAHGLWTIENVDDDDSQYIEGTYILLTSDGRPVIVYGKQGGFHICVATWNGDDWIIEEEVNEEISDEFSAAIDDEDRIHIAYAVFDASELRHLYNNGDEWVEEIVDTEHIIVETYPSIAVNSENYLGISYMGTLDNDLRYAYFDGYEWVCENVTDSLSYLINGYRSSLEFDNNDNPHISFFMRYGYPYQYELKYAFKEGYEWSVEVITSDHTPIYTSIALDGYEDPWIGFLENVTPCEIWVANKTEPEWELELAFEDAVFTMNSAFEADNSGIPHFVYSDGYATWNGVNWDSEVIDPDYNTSYASLTFDGSNHPHVSYVASIDVSDWELRYARRYDNNPPGPFNLLEPPNGSIVTEPVTLDWEDSTDGDGHDITYDIWCATDPSFDPHDEVNELTDSTYTFPEGTLSDGTTYYWKVRAWDGYDETWSGPDEYWSFTVEDEVTDISVTSFSAESERNGIEVTWDCVDPGVGFNLYRSEETTGVRTKLREMINAELITGESPYSYLDAAVEEGTTYSYWLEAIDVSGTSETFGPVSCTAGTFVPTSYALYQSRPNPARGVAVIAFDLPEDTEVTLTVYDLSGRKVATLVGETLPAGAYERSVSGLAPGVYVYRLLAEEFSAFKKMVVIR